MNEKGTREKNDGNEDLSLDDNEKIEADSEAESFVEEDWIDPEQGEVPKWTEPDLPIPAGFSSGNRKVGWLGNSQDGLHGNSQVGWYARSSRNRDNGTSLLEIHACCAQETNAR